MSEFIGSVLFLGGVGCVCWGLFLFFGMPILWV
jgi:hypothetical protein